MSLLNAQDAVEQTPTATAPSSTAPKADTPFFLRKILWALATFAMLFFAVDGFFTFEMQSGAPQQAAASAAASFHMITVYVIARGLDQLLRGPASLG